MSKQSTASHAHLSHQTYMARGMVWCRMSRVKVLATSLCISGTVSHGLMLEQRYRSCRSNFLSHPATLYGPTSPSADPTTPGSWQGSHRSANFYVTGMTRLESRNRTPRMPHSRRTAKPLGQLGGPLHERDHQKKVKVNRTHPKKTSRKHHPPGPAAEPTMKGTDRAIPQHGETFDRGRNEDGLDIMGCSQKEGCTGSDVLVSCCSGPTLH